MKDELDQIRERYARRASLGLDGAAESLLLPHRYMMLQERERAFLSILSHRNCAAINTMGVLEIGCGEGDNILQLLRWGFPPEKIKGSELLPSRCSAARRRLPAAVEIIEGDARDLHLPESSFDIVLAATVFTSILDSAFRIQLSNKIWSLVKPGGGVLWYDFIYNNPTNPDVSGIPLGRVVKLFPQATATSRRITLAPPIARCVCRIHPGLYTLFNLLPILRTHIVVWLEKAREPVGTLKPAAGT